MMFDQLIDKTIWEAKLNLANQAGATSAIVTQTKWRGKGFSAILAFRDWVRVERLVAVVTKSGYTVTIWTQPGDKVALSVDNGPSLLPADSKWDHLVTLSADEAKLLVTGDYIGDTLFPEGSVRDKGLGFSKSALDFKVKTFRDLLHFSLFGLKNSFDLWQMTSQWADYEEELRKNPSPINLYNAEDYRGEVVLAYIREVEDALRGNPWEETQTIKAQVFTLADDIVKSHEPFDQLKERVTAELSKLKAEAKSVQEIIELREQAKRAKQKEMLEWGKSAEPVGMSRWNGVLKWGDRLSGTTDDEVSAFRKMLMTSDTESFLSNFLEELPHRSGQRGFWQTTEILLEAERRWKGTRQPEGWTRALVDFGYSDHYRQWTEWVGAGGGSFFIRNTQAVSYLSEYLPLTRDFAYGSEKDRLQAFRQFRAQAFIEGRTMSWLPEVKKISL